MAKDRAKWRAYRPIVGLTVLSMLVCGLAFPILVTGLSQAIFPYQANGSLVQLGGHTAGSYYIDNGFTSPIFFHARNETNPSTASGSGVDPDIPLQDALNQISRIHNATGISVSDLTSLVTSHEQRTLLIFGDSYVNVLSLNLALISAYHSVYSNYD